MSRVTPADLFLIIGKLYVETLVLGDRLRALEAQEGQADPAPAPALDPEQEE